MTTTSSRASEARERVLSKWAEIKEQDPFGVLGLSAEATPGEIKAAYFALAREFHADAWGDVPLGDAKPVLDLVFARVAEAYDVLSDPQKRAELDAERAIKAAGMSTDLSALLDAEQDFSKGRMLLERGEITAAARFIEKAVATNPGNTEWRAHHLFVSWWPRRDKADAPQRIQQLEAIGKQDERLLDALYFAGRLALEIGELDRAARHLKHVARERPGHDMATRDLRLLSRKLDERHKQKPAGGLFGKLFGKRSAR